MNYTELSAEAVKRTNAYIGQSPENWVTFNNKINTRVLNIGEELQTNINMLEGEIPILECHLDNSNLIITTHRVISKIENNIQELYISEIEGFESTNDKLNFKPDTEVQPQIHYITIRGEKGKKLNYIIDSYFPSFFARLLIYNLSSFVRNNRWYC